MSSPRHQTQTTGHRYALKRLSSYMDGQLSDRERARVRAHLQACPECRDELHTLRWTQNLTQQIPVMPVPRSFILREADLETRHIAQPRPLLVPALARLQTAAAIVAVLLVTLIAGDVLVGRRLPGAQSARPPAIEAPVSEPIAKAPKEMQALSATEPLDPAPDAQDIMAMVVPTETQTIDLQEMGAPKLLASPTPDAIAEPSPTLTLRPTWTPTKPGHPAEETLTKNTPTATATATLEPTYTPTLELTHTPVPEPTAAATFTIAPAAPPARTPTSEPAQAAQVQNTPAQAQAEDETFGPGEEPTPQPGQRGQWKGWRITQIGLGAVLIGLMIAILWLRNWGRLG